MNVLFLSLSSNVDIEDSQAIYGSLLKEMINNNCNVFAISPSERRNNKKTHLLDKGRYKLLKVRTGNIQKTNILEKGISTLLIEHQFKKAIKKYFKNIKFDLILYATPPITFSNVIKYVKKRDNATTYLMLKDIFPQNDIDLKMFTKKSLIYKFFRKKEINLYKLSDYIGCMSPRNIEYLLESNKYLDNSKIELFPNSINPRKENIRDYSLNKEYRKKYNIPISSKVFMYGGNLGKPQGIPFIIDCLESLKNYKDIFFVICGSGTEYNKLLEYKNNNNINNFLLINGLPKVEYTKLLNVADVGLIFLDYNFSIPNFPSRVLSYMEKGIPVLSCTDPNTDVGDVITKYKFGWSIESNSVNSFKKIIKEIAIIDEKEMKELGTNGNRLLFDKYNSIKNIDIILSKVGD